MKKIILFFSLLLITGVYLNAQTVDLTLKVDMNVEIALGNFDPAVDVVRAAGAFQGWSPSTSPDMLDADNDHVYEMTYPVEPNQTYEYKFLIGTDWGKDEFQGQSNRSVTVGADAVIEGPFFFNKVGVYTEIPAEITFNADMTLPIKQGNVIPGTTNVYVAGNFTDWGGGAAKMEDPDGDSTYSVTIDTVLSGTVLQYKYIYSAGEASSGSWEDDPNKVFGVVDGANEITRFWNNTNPNVTIADGNILFSVDMSVMDEIGIYDPESDSVQVRGGFNGWSDSEPDRSKMNQDFLNPNIWSINVSFTGTEIGATQLYKFFVAKADENDLWTDGWERPLAVGGGNRPVPFEGSETQELPTIYYDNVHPDWVIEQGTSVQITFRVNMTPATDPALQAAPFVPATDTVWWINNQPAFTRAMGWVDTDQMRVLQMTDPDGDMVYEGTLTVNGPAFNAFEYSYAFASSSGFDGEAGGFGDFAYRVRFISQTGGARHFDSPYTAPLDTWDDSDATSFAGESESGPAGLTSVKEINGLPNTYSLEQNYPNPFNPTTKIRFSVPQSGVVTLKVFNVLGQEVSTLLNRELKAGTFEADFNAAGLSSGVYFYTLSTGNFNVTKKMLMLK